MSAQAEFWMVMDSRANYDIDAATCLEAFSEKPGKRKLRAWHGYSAVLVRSYAPDEKGVYTKSEVVRTLP